MPALRAVGLALLAGILLAPAAQAKLPSSIETTVAPGGNSSIASPTLSPTMKSATVDVVPVSVSDELFFENMQVVLSLQPTPGKRLLMCIGLYVNVAHGIDESVELQFPEQVHPLAVLLLSACLEQAAQIDRAQQAKQSATSAAAKCNRLATQVGAKFTRVGRKYRAEIDGTPTKLKQRGRLKVTCKRKGAGFTMKMRPTAKGKSLRSVVGPRLRIGVYNSLDATGSGRVKVTFRRSGGSAAEAAVRGADGSYAVAAPGIEEIESGPVLAGASVLWVSSSVAGPLVVRRADGRGRVSKLYSSARYGIRGDLLGGLAASGERVVLLTERGLQTGPVGGPLRRVHPAVRAFRNRSGCPRGRVFLNDRVGVGLSLSGQRVAYTQRLECPGRWRGSRYELVVENLRSRRIRVVRRGDVTSATLAGRFLAYQPSQPLPGVVVFDLRANRVAYATPRPVGLDDQLHWGDLDEQGRLVGAYFEGISLDGPLGWLSPAEPSFHPLGQTVSIFSGAPLAVAGGRIAFVRSVNDKGYEFLTGDLAGSATKHARFTDREALTSFAFDGQRVAWVVTPYRRYRGSQDDGLPYICDPWPLVPARAPTIEVHPAAAPVRFDSRTLPRVPEPRDRRLGGPFCGD